MKNASADEIRAGWYWMLFQILLSGVLPAANDLLPRRLEPAELNAVFYAINFCAVAWIFRRFLVRSFRTVREKPIRFLLICVLGTAACIAIDRGLGWALAAMDPGFANQNNEAVSAMVLRFPVLMAMGTVVLVPVAEECFFRQLIFAGLYEKAKPTAYLVSGVLFAAIHVVGALGKIPLYQAGLSLLQYLPAGLILAAAYVGTDTIFAPILIHSLINLSSFLTVIR